MKYQNILQIIFIVERNMWNVGGCERGYCLECWKWVDKIVGLLRRGRCSTIVYLLL